MSGYWIKSLHKVWQNKCCLGPWNCWRTWTAAYAYSLLGRNPATDIVTLYRDILCHWGRHQGELKCCKFCLFSPSFKPQGIWVYLFVLPCLYLIQRPLFHNNTTSLKNKPSLRNGRFLAPEITMLVRKIILNTVLLFLW